VEGRKEGRKEERKERKKETICKIGVFLLLIIILKSN
jgi:hypothetical protein